MRDAFVESEGLLEEFEPLDDALMTYPADLLDGVDPSIHRGQLATNLSHFGWEKILQDLTGIFKHVQHSSLFSDSYA